MCFLHRHENRQMSGAHTCQSLGAIDGKWFQEDPQLETDDLLHDQTQIHRLEHWHQRDRSLERVSNDEERLLS